MSKQQKKKYYVEIEVDFAPDDEKEFKKYCEKYNFDYLSSGRRAWCSQFQTYFRGACGVANMEGESFLVYEEDLIEISEVTNA